jgi:hypothetical protein
MKNEKEKIDNLLERNADEQLSTVDWDRLNMSILQKLDNAGCETVWAVQKRIVLKFAAGFAAAAAVVVVVIMLTTETPKPVQTISDGKATVSLIDNKGAASVEIKRKEFANAIVQIGGPKEKKNIARCDIEIIKTNGDTQKPNDRATWMIIRVPEPVLADIGIGRDQKDLACLL